MMVLECVCVPVFLCVCVCVFSIPLTVPSIVSPSLSPFIYNTINTVIHKLSVNCSLYTLFPLKTAPFLPISQSFLILSLSPSYKQLKVLSPYLPSYTLVHLPFSLPSAAPSKYIQSHLLFIIKVHYCLTPLLPFLTPYHHSNTPFPSLTPHQYPCTH